MLTQFLKHYLLTLIGFLILDGIWLAVVAKGFYQTQLGFLFADSPKWWAAGLFYLLFVAGLVVFVVSPGIQDGKLGRAVLMGALFGLVAYATYDLTNLATIKGWPPIVTVVDLCWGAFLSAGTTLFSVWLGLKWS